jgi:hypothetical protein
MWKLIAVLAILLISLGVNAAERPEVSWLVESKGGVVIAQVWPPGSNHGPSLWRVISTSGAKLSEMQEPPLEPGFTYTYGECLSQGKLASGVIAQIRVSAASLEALTVGRAWKLDPVTNSFAPTATPGLSCYNADYGL